MERLFLLSFVAKLGFFLMLGYSFIQAIVWSTAIFMMLTVGWRIVRMVFPGGPTPVPPGEIEDAVLIYTWGEAIAFNAGGLRACYVLALAVVLVSFY